MIDDTFFMYRQPQLKLTLKANYTINFEISAKTDCGNLLIYCHLVLAEAYMLLTKKKVRKETIQFHYATF